MKLRFILRFFAALAVFTLVALPSKPNMVFSAEKVVVFYSSQAISNSMPWIAEDAGLFRKYELDSQLIYITTSQLVTALMLRGDGEVGLTGGAAFVRAFVQGASDFVIIGGIKNILSHSILAGPEIKKPEDLKGKKIGVSRIGANPHYFTIQALRRFGIDPARDGVTFIQTGEASGTLAALVNGAVHAGTLTAPADAQAIARGFHFVVYGPDLRIPYANTFFASRRSLIAKRPRVVGQFMQAMAEAAKIMHTNKSLTYKVLAKQYRVEDRKILDSAYNPEVKVLERKLDIKHEGLQAILDEVSQIDPRAKKVKPQDLIDSRYLDEMQKSGFLERLWEEDRS
ncbi:MAG: ABC transporter substrate-binding protein [Deltaproteobacteria bacterium]|nr:ABC transporter substrate-binding protein [Deltaproteobacteria bacterium]